MFLNGPDGRRYNRRLENLRKEVEEVKETFDLSPNGLEDTNQGVFDRRIGNLDDGYYFSVRH